MRLIPFGVIKWVLYLARLGHLCKRLGGEVQDSTFLRFQGHVDYQLALGAILDGGDTGLFRHRSQVGFDTR